MDRDNYTEFLKSSPIEFGEEESKVLNAKMDELDSNVSNWFSMLSKLRGQKEMTKRKIEQERAKFALDMTIPVKSFLAMMDENNSEIFGDIPEFYSAIKDSESNVSAELKQFKEGGLVSIFGDPDLENNSTKAIHSQINLKTNKFQPI